MYTIRFRRLSLVGTAVMALLLGSALFSGLHTAHAAAATAQSAPSSRDFRYGNYLSNGWFCFGFSSGIYHCTQHYHYVNGRAVSLNPGFVPNGTSGTAAATTGGHTAATTGGEHEPDGDADDRSAGGSSSNNSGGGVVNRGGGGNTAGYPFGQCTWGAARLSWDNVSYLGNAKDWFANAQARGLPTGYTPRVGATVVYQPGVQGASALGHVAHVVAVYGNGTFLVEEMNYYGFGGGFGVFSYRTSHTGWGVSFIY
jgi:surface antigen